MSTDWFFTYKKKRYEEIIKKIEESGNVAKKETDTPETKCYAICNIDKTKQNGFSDGNAGWIYITNNGTGILTRYAGTSPENLGQAFTILDTIIQPTECIDEYEIQEKIAEENEKHSKHGDYYYEFTGETELDDYVKTRYWYQCQKCDMRIGVNPEKHLEMQKEQENNKRAEI